MLRFALFVVSALSFFDSAHAGWIEDFRKENDARRAAFIKASKIPPVSLSDKQKAKLPLIGAEPKIIWLGAGRQKEGKVFVCYLTSGKDNFRSKILSITAGTFESDGSFQTSSRLSGDEGVLNTCWKNGFAPPVKLRRRYY